MTELLAKSEFKSDQLQMIESSHQRFPLSKVQEEELDRRLVAHRAKPDDVVPWDVIKSELLDT